MIGLPVEELLIRRDAHIHTTHSLVGTALSHAPRATAHGTRARARSLSLSHTRSLSLTHTLLMRPLPLAAAPTKKKNLKKSVP